jgi:hypothetical protein
MLPIALVLSQQVEPERVLNTGWLDPLFIFFVVASAVQLLMFVWLLASGASPKLSDDAWDVRGTAANPLPEPTAPSLASEADIGLPNHERSPARMPGLLSRFIAFGAGRATLRASPPRRLRSRSVHVCEAHLPQRPRARMRRAV